jgi:two-component system sensor histidine kinase RegB
VTSLPGEMMRTSIETSIQPNLIRLFTLRNVEIIGQLAAVLTAEWGFGIPLPIIPMLIVIGFLALVNLVTWSRLRRTFPVTDIEFFIQLLADVIVLAVLLYLSGGSTNPFVSLFLLPLTLTATALPARYSWFMACITVALYTLLLFYHVPIGHPFPDDSLPGTIICRASDLTHIHGGEAGFSLHILGMWFNYAVSSVLISFFVVKMAASLRQRDRLLALAREESLRNEQLISLGTLAAGAAHELGTPLATMAVIVKEMEHDYAGQGVQSRSLQILHQLIYTCKQILTRLTSTAGAARAEGESGITIETYISELTNLWGIMRPSTPLHVGHLNVSSIPRIKVDQTLTQALMNLLNNAADASPQGIEIQASRSDQNLLFEIRDRGPGLTPEVTGHAGKLFFTTKGPEGGLGLGLFLANATIERLGGKVSMFNQEGGGACVCVTLPLERLAAGMENE